MEKVIYNIYNDKMTIIDSNNEIIPNIVHNKKLLDIDFKNFPSNVLNNLPLYLGKEYKLFDFDLQSVKNILINDEIFFDEKSKWYKDKLGKFLYNYENNIKILNINYNIYDLCPTYKFSWFNVLYLYTTILKEHYNWEINQINDYSYNGKFGKKNITIVI